MTEFSSQLGKSNNRIQYQYAKNESQSLGFSGSTNSIGFVTF